MRIQYTYKEYKDFPVATDISQTRERNKIYIGGLLSAIILLCIAFMGADFEEQWGLIFVVIGCIGCFVYLCTKYNEVTKKKIQKAIEDEIDVQQNAKKYRYYCEYIKVFDESSKIGSCLVCGAKSTKVTLCKVKSRVGTRQIHICDECIKEYQEGVAK